MILVDPKDRSGNHYINERALTFSENDLEDPQRIAVSLVSGTVIMVNKKDDGDGVSIPRAANGDYEKWTLKGYSTKIPEGRNAAHYIFARLSRSERTALIVFSLNNYNIDGSVSTFTTNEDGSVTELRSEASSDYYYIRIGYLSETDGSSDRVLTYDCGQLSVGYEIDDIRGAWNELFVPHYDDPANPKELTWIEAKSHMGVNGGVTMFVDNGSLDLPSLYEGLPVDGDTLYWEEDEEGNKVLKAKTPEETTTTLGSLTNVGEWADGAATADRIMVQKKGSDQWVSLSLEELGTASFENVKESGEGNAYTSIVLSEDKKTLTLKKGETFAKQSDYEALNTKVTDFLEGEDTDTIINKWKELETFLGGMSESDELATILSGKADKGTTLEDYGITDAYTKTEIDSALDDYVTIKGKEEITGEKNFTGGLKVNGSPIVYDKDNEYWKLDGDLLITGAVTMFANEGKYTPSTIMDAVSVDGSTIMNDGSKLYLNPDLELGGGLDESALASYLTTNKYLTQTTGDTRYVTALGTSGNYLTYTKNGVTTDVTVPYATTAKELTSYSAITFSKSDNGGKPCYLLIADVTSWYNVSSGSLSYGIVGFVYGYRDGATPAYSVNIAARCSYGKGYYSLNSNLTSIIESRVVSYNSKYYLALYLRGSNGTFNFIGRKDNLLSSFTELQCSDSSGTYSGLSVIYSGSAIGTASTATKLSTARIISITGHATGSGSFDGSSDLGINVAIPTRNVYINGTGYTVHSTITTDTTGIYAPTSGGTSGYVLKANGATSIPTWVAQSSLSVGTASKLSTVSKTAWGQTYWTSGGVPTDVSGDIIVGNGKILLNNNYALKGKDSDGNDTSIAYVSPSNNVILGSSYHNGYLSGTTVNIRYGSTSGIYLDEIGNVGFGTTSPDYKIHADGDIYTNSKVIVDGISIYKSSTGVLRIDGDVVLSGALTMFGTDSVTASTVMDGVNVDGITIVKSGNKLMLNPDLELGGGLDESALASYLTTNKYLTQTTGDTRYVTALGTSGNYLTYTKNGVTTDVTVPYATTAKELTSYSAITFSKSDNGGKPCYLLIADVTSWYNVSSGSLSYGIVGFVYGYRDGATPAYSVNIAARCSYGKGYYSLNSNLTSIIESRVVSYNSKYYLALYLRGSNGTFNFIGRKDNLLSSFTELQCSDSSGTYSGLSVIYSGSAIGTASTATKLSTARIISITGHATGSGSFDGSSDLGINVAIPTRNVYINGTGYTVHSTITTDTTGIYAPTSGGTSGYVLKANGATSIPTWVAQSSLSVGTAAKLSTVSKTAWGQTYWTSGGVPTSISGDMTGVGSITMSGFINYNDYTVFRYSASTGDGGVSTGASLLGSPSLATTLRSSGDDLYHWNEANSAKYLIFDTNNFTNYTNKALTKKNSGTNLLTDGDKYIGAQNYLIGTYTYASFVTNGVKYRCTLCGKLGDDNTHIAAYWDGGLGNNTTISGLSSTEERTISFTATITNKQRLSFYQFPNGKFGSYIKWCKLEVEEDVTGDTSTYLYNIDRIDFANDSNSHNFGIDRNGTVYGYNAGVLKLRRGISSGGSFVQYEANNQTVYGWRAGSDNSYKFSWWYYNTSSGTDEQKMSLDSSGNLQVTGDVYTDNSYFVKGTTGAGNGYSLYNESLPTQYGIFMGTTSNFNKHGGVTGGWATYFCMNGYNESRGWIFRNSYNSTNVASITTNGDLLVNGGITMYSDERKKTILNHVELSLKEVADAPLIEHYYNSDDRKTIHVGSIAQYWAGLNDWFCKKDSEGFYTMEIQNAALASAISVARELSRFESDTDRRIRLLEEENRELRKEIEQLKSV